MPATRFSRQGALIDAEHQRALHDATVAVAGLGVGAAVVAQCAQLGIGGFRLCDGDTVELHNLNRHPIATLDAVGALKTEVVARYCLGLDPGVRLEIGAPIDARGGAHNFVLGASVVVDEVDEIAAKWALRAAAAWHGVPLLMATDLGDTVVLDVERYDLDPEMAPFQGVVTPEMPVAQQLTTLFRSHCAAEFWSAVVSRTPHESFPQLGSAVALAGAVTAVAIREIVAGQPFPTGRYVYGLGLRGAGVIA